MRFYWFVISLSTLLSLALLMVIMGQYQMLSILKTKNEQLQKHSEKLYNDLRNDEVFKNTVEKLVNQGTKAVKDLEATVTQLSSEMKKKKTEDDACQKEKKAKNDELASNKKGQTKTKDTLKVESDAWYQEMKTLKAQLTANSPICKYVKKNEQTEKLCGFTTTALTSH